MSKKLYTTKEIAALLDISPSRVRQLVETGEITSEKFGRDRFFTIEAIAQAKQRKTKPGPATKPRPSANGSGKKQGKR